MREEPEAEPPPDTYGTHLPAMERKEYIHHA